MRFALYMGLAAATGASTVSQLRSRITAESALRSMPGAGPFKVHDAAVVGKVSTEGVPVHLAKERQQMTWNPVEGNSLIEAWSISPDGIVVKHKHSRVPVACGSLDGQASKSAVSIRFDCGVSLLEGDGWPVKTGYDGDYHPEAFDAKDEQDMKFDPRVRFWHRCADDSNKLSLCNKYNFIGADAMGYYGCDYTTVDGFCVKSYRHEWVEFNPNDLPFVYNPPVPCPHDHDPEAPCRAAGRFVPDPASVRLPDRHIDYPDGHVRFPEEKNLHFDGELEHMPDVHHHFVPTETFPGDPGNLDVTGHFHAQPNFPNEYGEDGKVPTEAKVDYSGR